jgi:hypothetical protein
LFPEETQKHSGEFPATITLSDARGASKKYSFKLYVVCEKEELVTTEDS